MKILNQFMDIINKEYINADYHFFIKTKKIVLKI